MDGRNWLFVFVSTFAAVAGINPYVFGLYNHYVTLPFYAETLEPALFPGDLLVAELEYFYTWFLKLLSGIEHLTGLETEWVFFLVYLLSIFFSVLAFFRLALTITDHSLASMLATAMFVFGFKTLGGVSTVESLLMERTLVLPLELFALQCLFRKRYVAAFALCGLAFSIHPLSAIYTAAMVGFAALLSHLRKPWMILPGCAVFLALASPALFLKFTADAPYLPGGTPDPQWLDILRLRSPHHVFPSTWSISYWITTLLFLVGGHFAVQQWANRKGHIQLKYASWAVLLMCVFGFICSEIIPLGLPIQFQFFRSFRFLVYLSTIYFAWQLVRALDGHTSTGMALGLMALMMPLWLHMDMLKLVAFAGIVLLVFPGWKWLAISWRFPALAFAIAAVGVAGLAVDGGFSPKNDQESTWLEAQQWAAQHTDLDAGFIVPPNRWGFRAESKRTIYGDWNDGTQNFFNAEFGRDWLVRMQRLGYRGNPDDLGKNYRELTSTQLESIADQMPENSTVYAVLFAQQDWFEAPVYSNSSYKIVKIR